MVKIQPFLTLKIELFDICKPIESLIYSWTIWYLHFIFFLLKLSWQNIGFREEPHQRRASNIITHDCYFDRCCISRLFITFSSCVMVYIFEIPLLSQSSRSRNVMIINGNENKIDSHKLVPLSALGANVTTSELW